MEKCTNHSRQLNLHRTENHSSDHGHRLCPSNQPDVAGRCNCFFFFFFMKWKMCTYHPTIRVNSIFTEKTIIRVFMRWKKMHIPIIRSRQLDLHRSDIRVIIKWEKCRCRPTGCRGEESIQCSTKGCRHC